ncbi:MAG: GTP cyclohydrolase I FolE [Chloroflexota bacterium]|nr:GTP cyclohydrolase I FolE [Chloroflexota bacterium]
MNGHETQMRTAQYDEIRQKLESKELLNRFGFAANTVDVEAVKRAIGDLLYAVGEDPFRDGLLETPKRVAKAYEELVSGYTTDPVELVNNAIYDIDYDDMVIVNNIDYYSLCEHHLLPFFGQACVAYIPNGRIIGLSKIPRIVDMFSRRLQVQERLTRQIAEFLDEVLAPQGVAVTLTAQHMCSTIRGVKKHNSNMQTYTMIGAFKNDREIRNEFLSQAGRSPNL